MSQMSQSFFIVVSKFAQICLKVVPKKFRKPFKVALRLSQSSLKVVQQASFPQAYNLGLGQLVSRATLVTLVKLVSQLVLQG